jgi:3D (Asp-Asp-Asp) domain-containing protein
MVPLEPEWEVYEATAYTAKCAGCSGITKTGINVRQSIVDDKGRRIIAVDPEVIPLGSTLEIRIGNNLDKPVISIEGVAADIGGAIKGRKIDVLMASYDEAIEFGRQDVEVRILGEAVTFEK